MIVVQTGPRIVERGVATSLTLDIYSDGNSQQTVESGGTITIRDGDEVLVDEASITSVGPPAAYSLAAATTSSRGLTDRWLEVWNVTIGSTAYEFQRAGYLVIRAFYPTITDTDLTNRHSELNTIRPSEIDSYEKYRVASAQRVERELLKMGRRPWLIFDPWALTDAHIALTLHHLFLDWATEFSQSRYKELADYYWQQWRAEFESVSFRYDASQDGNLNEDEKIGAAQPLVLTQGNIGWFR